MQRQTAKSTFWKKLKVWLEALDSTSSDYQQDQIMRLRIELYEVNRRVDSLESGVITKPEPSQVDTLFVAVEEIARTAS